MVAQGVLVFVLNQGVQVKFRKLYLEPIPIRIYTESMWTNYEGSWSRGYDVALTWQRSPVQFWPSPLLVSIGEVSSEPQDLTLNTKS